ncbi:hypothetical protein [Evansella cellulosilytica]|uniref:Uncharacterized protein n=1 Tax=Evansella cellulosilytica (strain ATCC 21833 / DSM 2522 / FERM P-1141 / JCM 9156 / N-4) TaxID=649639 RepID=E6TR30_EVAC2|nr:hypothetical protein [Evansella cellulosilytica]ADU29406.1 hypothetical protein Bcell_1138 [Evansella cellulosilytica DSM 2522]
MKEIIKGLLGFGIIGLILYAGYSLVTWIIYTIDPQIAAAILTGGFTILLSAITIVISRNYESKQKIKEENRMKKIPVYDEFLKFMFRVLDPNDNVKDIEIKKFAKKFNPDLLIWGSSDVVQKYSEYRYAAVSNLKNENRDKINKFKEFETLLLSIRKDLGHKDKNVRENDFLRVFINDIDKET